MMPAIVSRAYDTQGYDGFYISANPFLREAQGANITSWAFWAVRAGCVVTPVVLRGTYRTPGTATGAIDFYIMKKGDTRTTTRAGAHNFSFVDNDATYLAPEYGLNAQSNVQMTQTFFGWYFTGQECFQYDLSTGAQTYSIWSPGDYTKGMELYSYDGVVPLLDQIWSVRVGSVRTAIIPSTAAAGASSIQSCSCPDGYQKLENGQCQGICPPGQYIANPSSSTFSPCRQGHYCMNSNMLMCPAGTASLAGASACTPCMSPGDGTDIQLHTCGLKTCAAKQPTPIGQGKATSVLGPVERPMWKALGKIIVEVGSLHGAINTPWLAGDTVVGMVLNPKSDRPYAMIETDLDQGALGFVWIEMAIQFS
jgi:hypothetical protein